MYNSPMSSLALRRAIAVLILLLSVGILIWGLWPFGNLTQTLPVDPVRLQLPTPHGLIPGLSALI